MAKQGQVTKTYELRTLGYQDLSKQLDNVTKKFEAIKKAKLATEGKLFAAQDFADIKKYAQEIAGLKKEEQQLRVERQRIMVDMKAAQQQRQLELDQQRKKVAANNAEAGSIKAIRNDIKELNNLIIQRNKNSGSSINFRNETLSYDQGISKLKELIATEQEYRRQFQRDNTLVGEYTSGIVDAFKKMGLEDLVGGQITKAQQRLTELNSSFDKLQQELKETKAAGLETETIEKQMIENRNEVIKLDTQLSRLKNELRGTGDIGNQITSSISNGFKNLKGQVSSFALQYVGFTALFNKITSEISAGIDEASKIEGVTAAFENLNRPDLLNQLRAATKGTVSDLELMQRAVQANNFQIPLEQMATLLEFARRRAKDTGVEVNFLVDSIITGIGRKSPLILDNLGISAVRLRQKLKGIAEENADIGDVAEAVGQIIREENAKLGKEVDTTSERLAKNKAEWQNIRAEFTKNLLPAIAAIGSFFLFLVTNLPTIGALLGVLAVGWAAVNLQLIIHNAQLAYYNLLIIRNYVALGILSVAQLSYNSILLVTNGVLKIVTGAMRLFGITSLAAAGPLRIILTIASLLGAAFLGLSKAMGNSTAALDTNTRKIKLLAEVTREANKEIAAQQATVEGYVAVINNSNVSHDTKLDLMKKLIEISPGFQKALDGETIKYSVLNDELQKYINNLQQVAIQKAAQARQEREIGKLGELGNIRKELEIFQASGFKNVEALSEETKQLLDKAAFDNGTIFKRFSTDTKKNVRLALSEIKKLEQEQKNVAGFTTEVLADILKSSTPAVAGPTLFDRFDALVKSGGTDKEYDALLQDVKKKRETTNRISAEYKKLVELEDKISKLLNPKDKKDKKFRGSQLTGEQKDKFKDIEARRDELLATNEKANLTGEIQEERYLNNLYQVNLKAIRDKLKLLDDSNAEERKMAAELRLEEVKLEQETNNKIYELKAKFLRDQLDISVKNAQEEADIVKNDPDINISATAKAQAQLDADKKILQAQQVFNTAMDELEKDRNNISKKNAEDRARAEREAQQNINKDTLALLLTRIEDEKTINEKLIAEFELLIDKGKLLIQADTSLSDAQKKSKLRILENQRDFGVLARQIALYKVLEKEFKKAYEAGLVTLAQYEEVIKRLAELQQQMAERPETQAKGFFDGFQIGFGENIISSLQEAGRDFGEKLFGDTEQGEQTGEAIAEAIGQSYSLAMDAMNSYFDAEDQRIRDNLQLQLDRLDMEKEQVQARAQSQAEIDSIEKQYATKKKKAEQEAGEKLKKNKRSELKIALAAELANIWASVWQLGPIVGPIAGAVFSGLAFGRYALRVAEINREKFEFGGKPGEVPVRGGEFGGKPHSKGGTDFSFKGKNYNAEVDELAIVRTKNAPVDKKFTVSGTQMQIASAINKIGGGINFKPGAKLLKFESGGYLGDNLQPPVFTAAGNNMFFNTGGVTEKKLDELIESMNRNSEEQSKRIDRLEVRQVTSTVTDAQRKQVKQSAIGTL